MQLPVEQTVSHKLTSVPLETDTVPDLSFPNGAANGNVNFPLSCNYASVQPDGSLPVSGRPSLREQQGQMLLGPSTSVVGRQGVALCSSCRCYSKHWSFNSLSQPRQLSPSSKLANTHPYPQFTTASCGRGQLPDRPCIPLKGPGLYLCMEPGRLHTKLRIERCV